MDRFHYSGKSECKGLKRLVDALPGMDGGFDFRGLLRQSGGAKGPGGALYRMGFTFRRRLISNRESAPNCLGAAALPHREFAQQRLVTLALAANALQSQGSVDSSSFKRVGIMIHGMSPASLRQYGVLPNEAER